MRQHGASWIFEYYIAVFLVKIVKEERVSMLINDNYTRVIAMCIKVSAPIISNADFIIYLKIL